MIFQGDFREFHVGDLDLVLTDPPYPREYLPLWSDLSRWAYASMRPGGLLAAYSGQSYLPEVYERLSERLVYVWTACLPTGGSSQIVWRNGITKPPFNVRTKWKPVLIFARPGGRVGSIATDLYPGSKKTGELHPWEQHVEPAEKLIRALSREGETVCDPMMGSGTFGVAAHRAGRAFHGCEIDADHYAVASQRLKEEMGLA